MNGESRPKAASAAAAGHATTFIDPSASISAALSDLFDGAVTAYYAALDAERWDLVYRVGYLVDAIHVLEEREADR